CELAIGSPRCARSQSQSSSIGERTELRSCLRKARIDSPSQSASGTDPKYARTWRRGEITKAPINPDPAPRTAAVREHRGMAAGRPAAAHEAAPSGIQFRREIAQ